MTPKEALACPFILKNSTKCTLQSPSRLNSSFEENDDPFNENCDKKFYDEDNDLCFSSTITEDIGVRFC